MKSIVCSRHALDQMLKRGVTRTEVEAAIREGEAMPAKRGQISFSEELSLDLPLKQS